MHSYVNTVVDKDSLSSIAAFDDKSESSFLEQEKHLVLGAYSCLRVFVQVPPVFGKSLMWKPYSIGFLLWRTIESLLLIDNIVDA